MNSLRYVVVWSSLKWYRGSCAKIKIIYINVSGGYVENCVSKDEGMKAIKIAK